MNGHASISASLAHSSHSSSSRGEWLTFEFALRPSGWSTPVNRLRIAVTQSMFLLFVQKFFVRRPKMKKNYALLLTLVMLLALAQMPRAQELSEIPTPPNGNNEKAEVSQ